jgi:hypothetical protein
MQSRKNHSLDNRVHDFVRNPFVRGMATAAFLAGAVYGGIRFSQYAVRTIGREEQIISGKEYVCTPYPLKLFYVCAPAKKP